MYKYNNDVNNLFVVTICLTESDSDAYLTITIMNYFLNLNG